MDKILFQMHIMWYESGMVSETLDSIQRAAQYSTLPIEYVFCLNSQTYIEEPIDGTAEQMFGQFLSHPLMNNVTVIHKTNADSFYNIGDWRREAYDPSAKYTVWGEADCLLPEDFFYILSNLSVDHPHILSFASRKMWDYTWDVVEHTDIQQYNRLPDNPYTAPTPLNAIDVITQAELDSFNDACSEVIVTKLETCKVDGALLTLSSNLPTPFIPGDMHFVREDTCAGLAFTKYGIPQYHVINRLKGHNYRHPNKRMNTLATRDTAVYQSYEQKSTMAMANFLQSL
jgi:hypothetical protein